MSTGFAPTQEWLDDVFREEVVPDLFADATPQERPVVVLLGGQPGAGKTRATQFAQAGHAESLVCINGDDFRVLHPDYVTLQAHDPVAMPTVTQHVSGPMVERAITHAREHRFSVLVEGTFRRPEVSLATAQEFHDAGYEVHVIALAVPPAVSRMSAVARFYETLDHGENRWTPLAAHEEAVAHMPETLAALVQSPVVDRLTLVDRSGEVLFDDTTPGPRRGAGVAARLRTHHERPLTRDERDQIRHTYDTNRHVAQTHPAARAIVDDPSVRMAWELLEDDQRAIDRQDDDEP